MNSFGNYCLCERERAHDKNAHTRTHAPSAHTQSSLTSCYQSVSAARENALCARASTVRLPSAFKTIYSTYSRVRHTQHMVHIYNTERVFTRHRSDIQFVLGVLHCTLHTIHDRLTLRTPANPSPITSRPATFQSGARAARGVNTRVRRQSVPHTHSVLYDTCA